MNASVVHVASGTLVSGAPGDGASSCTGSGAAGLLALSSNVSIAQSVTLLPSATVCGGTSTTAPPTWGEVIEFSAETFPTLSLTPAPVHAGSAMTLRLTGEAGAFAVLAIGTSAGPAVALPPFDGATILASAPLALLLPAVLDGAGEAQFAFITPATPEFAGASFFAQSLVLAGADAAFSNPVVIAGAP